PRLATQISTNSYVSSPSPTNRSAVRTCDSADRDQRLARKSPRPAHAIHTDDWIGILFAGRCEYRADGNVVCRGLISFRDLLGIVRRNSEPAVWPDDSPGTLRQEVVLAYVDAVELSSEAKICTIVHDQLD